MNKYKQWHDIDESKAITIIAKARNRSEAVKLLDLTPNSTGSRGVDKLVKKYDIDTKHFDRNWKNRKYKKISKKCPICNKEFEILKGHKKNKTTCSYACSNTYHRTGEQNGNYNPNKTHYTSICFKHHKKECVICGEQNIVAVHHYNHDHYDNKPENLVPLCPTHHMYWHSKYRHLIQEKVDKYVKQYIEMIQ